MLARCDDVSLPDPVHAVKSVAERNTLYILLGEAPTRGRLVHCRFVSELPRGGAELSGATGSDHAVGGHPHSTPLHILTEQLRIPAQSARECVQQKCVNATAVRCQRRQRMFRKLALLLAVIAATSIGVATAHAQNIRTWVSGTGTNSGSCSRAAPCLTFSYALSQTNSGGEIDCLDPGGFGAVTITISVIINCEGPGFGAIETNGSDAVTINTSGITVNLIGLILDGENSDGGVGVVITGAATVNIRDCKIYGFVHKSGFTGSGILVQPSATGATLVVDNVLIADNSGGIALIGSTGASNMTVRNSNINNNNFYGIDVEIDGGTHAGATIEQTTMAFNGIGLLVEGSGAVAVLGGSTVVNNTTGVSNSGGTVYSFKNNQIGGNGTDGTPLTAYPGGPLN